jgi:pimeloyl-ACP methyl ester carboxylesterase
MCVAGALGTVGFGKAAPRTIGGADEEAARRHESERRFVTTAFGNIAYVDRGTGTVALFLHGFPLNSFQWRGVIDRLSSQRRCVAPDLLGLGHTEIATGHSVTPDAQVDMVTAFLDRLGIAQVDLIANDSGGAVAQLLLAKNPQRVRTLLLTNCDVETDSPPAAIALMVDCARAGLFADLYLEPWVQHKDVARSESGLGGICYSNAANPTDAALEQYLRPLVASPERKALVNRYMVALAVNALQGIAPVLRKCTVPTRIVWGMGDIIFSPRSPDYLAGVLPNIMEIRRIPQAKLFFPEEYPDTIAAEARLLWNG